MFRDRVLKDARSLEKKRMTMAEPCQTTYHQAVLICDDFLIIELHLLLKGFPSPAQIEQGAACKAGQHIPTDLQESFSILKAKRKYEHAVVE